MTQTARIFEMEYSVSPGGIDCWEVTIPGYGFSENYTDFKTAGDALNYLINKHPNEEFDINIMSIGAYNKLMEMEDNL